jgi:hypothetical protein
MSLETPTAPRKCEAVTKRGEPCQGWALDGGRFCWAHDPDKAADRRAASAKGGRGRRGYRAQTASDLEGIDIITTGGAMAALGAALRDTAGLPNSISRNRCMGYLAAAILDALHHTDHEERLAAIEDKLRGGTNGKA